jgi:hypothetical protein
MKHCQLKKSLDPTTQVVGGHSTVDRWVLHRLDVGGYSRQTDTTQVVDGYSRQIDTSQVVDGYFREADTAE